MMTTIAPTRAIRTNNNSLSPKRLNTVRTSDLLLIMPLNQRGKADARMIMSDFQPFWVLRRGRIERFRTGRTVRIRRKWGVAVADTAPSSRSSSKAQREDCLGIGRGVPSFPLDATADTRLLVAR